MRLTLFFTRGMSLAAWARGGLIHRETAIYRRLIEAGWEVGLVTYGGKSDLDLAADAAVNAGFGSAGERCMAISALVAVEPVADALVAKIAERMAGLRTGDGRRGCDMGPLVTAAHAERVRSYVEAGVAAGSG